MIIKGYDSYLLKEEHENENNIENSISDPKSVEILG